jgi:hypothetical protein
LWIQKNNFAGLARKGAIGLLIETKGYMQPGFDGSFQKDFWRYNPNSNGIENVENKIQVSVSPNPFSSVCIIEIKNNKPEIKNEAMCCEVIKMSFVTHPHARALYCQKKNPLTLLALSRFMV